MRFGTSFCGKFLLLLFLIVIVSILIDKNNYFKNKIQSKYKKIDQDEGYCLVKQAKKNLTLNLDPPKEFKPFKFYSESRIHKIFNDAYYSIMFQEIKLGGHYEPTVCKSRSKLAIIVSYRDREQNLNTFLLNIHPYLMSFRLNYTIFLVEQVKDEHFNKGMLYNAAYREIIQNKRFGYEFDCILLHDIDLLPTGKIKN